MQAKEEKKTDKFFVYGTLKAGGLFADDFDEYRISTKDAKLPGFELFNLGWFPAIQPGKATVHGELHEYEDPDLVTAMFDRIEGYTGNPKNSLYDRRRVVVETEDGEEEAWVYVFQGTVSKESRIESGVWEI